MIFTRPLPELITAASGFSVFKKNRYGSLVPDHDLENVTLSTYVAACLELTPAMNVRGRLKTDPVMHLHTA